MYRLVLGLVAICWLGALGCSGGRENVVEVEGVLVGPDNKPMPNIQITFTPADSEGKKVITSTGITNNEGKFTLKADNGKPGAVLGKHKVTLVDNLLAEADDQPKPGTKLVNRVPQDYSSPGTTKLQVTVEAGKKSYSLKME